MERIVRESASFRLDSLGFWRILEQFLQRDRFQYIEVSGYNMR